MQVAATKLLTKYLNENKPNCTSVEHIYYTTTTKFNYCLLVDNPDFNRHDYLEKTDRMRFLQVVYKPKCYAMSRALTTREIDKIFSVNHCKTLDDLIFSIYEEIEI